MTKRKADVDNPCGYSFEPPLLRHKRWPKLRLLTFVNGGPTNRRIELHGKVPRWASAIKVSCVQCGATIYPIRMSRGRFYLAQTCALSVDVACSRSTAARDAAHAVRAAM